MMNYTKLYTHYNANNEPFGIVWETDTDGSAIIPVYAYSCKAGVWSCEYLPQVDEEQNEEQDEEPTPCCDECGAELDDDAIEHDGQAFCSHDCLSDAGFIVLDDGDIVNEEDAVFTVDDEWQHRGNCVEIREYRWNPPRTITVYYLEGDDRLAWCEDVQEYRLAEDTICLANGDTVSQDADVYGCEGCGEYFYSDDIVHEEHGSCYCADCYEPPVAGADRIYRYSTDVISVCGFAHNPRNVRTYGVELEVENGDAESVDDALDGCGILKEDGSLDSGFEIVTRPAPMDETKRVILAAAAAAKASGSKSYNTNTCGFHVHVARKGLSDLRIGKLVAFFQSVDTAGELRKVAQRDSSRWAKTGQGLKVTQKPADRYTALNLQNEHTIEVRIFKGTLDATSLTAYLDFVELVVEWSAVCSLSDCYKWMAFVQYVKDKGGKQGKSLLAWMSGKGCKV